jgi:hypothetical protein
MLCFLDGTKGRNTKRRRKKEEQLSFSQVPGRKRNSIPAMKCINLSRY